MSLKRNKGRAQHGIKQFANSRERDMYMNSFHGRKVIIERQVQLSDFSDRFLKSLLIQRGWYLMVKREGSVNVNLVREFYAYSRMSEAPEISIQSKVRGHEISITADDLCELLTIPRVPKPDFKLYEGNSPPIDVLLAELQKAPTVDHQSIIPVSSLKREYRLLNLIFFTNIMPEVDLGVLVDHYRCFWLYIIGKGYTIDLPTLMLTTMGEVSYSFGGLPYGLFITQLLEQVGVPTLPSDTIEHSGRPLSGLDVLSARAPLQYDLPTLIPRQLPPAAVNPPTTLESLQRQISELQAEVEVLKGHSSSGP